jgi:AICAR transformylase/IMP cyclohydrolase PurH (only IMP cyclohydrolase domain in Aful)
MGNKKNLMKKIKSALISLSDKKNIKPLLQILRKNNIKVISSGGTFKTIKKLKFKC